MRKRGPGPKHVLVPKYAMWRNGKRLSMRKHKRGADPQLHTKTTDRQYHFGFY